MWLLVDANNWFAADWYAAKDSAPSNFCKRLRDVVSLIQESSGGELNRIALAFDSRESFRREIDRNYKATRRQKPDDYWHVLNRLHEQLAGRVEVLRVESFTVEGFEADDILASLTWHAKHEGEQVVICSSDKDLHALLCKDLVTQATKIERVAQTRVRANWLTAEGLEKAYGVRPTQWVDYRCMVGDGSDGLKGCPGVGPETAREVIRASGSLEEFWRSPFVPHITPRHRTKLIQFHEEAKRLRSLITLRDDCLTGERPSLVGGVA